MTVVINRDVNARRKDYRHLGNGQVLVTSIFPTLQGEGPFAGRSAVFVRLAGCNLGAKKSCPWCDTSFTLSKGERMLDHEVEYRARCKLRPNCPPTDRLMVLTGGEPLMQPSAAILINYFLEKRWQVQVETNGYFWSEDLEMLAAHWRQDFTVVLSPKVAQDGKYPKMGRALLAAACLKILVDADPDSLYHKVPDFADYFAQTTGRPVYVSPINHYLRAPMEGEVASFWSRHPHKYDLFDWERCQKNHEYAAVLAMERGYRLSLQTHLFAAVE